MKMALLALTILAQTACVSALRPSGIDRYSPSHTTYLNSDLYKMSREYEQKNAKQWAEWDKKYVSDDVIVVEIYGAKQK